MPADRTKRDSHIAALLTVDPDTYYSAKELADLVGCSESYSVRKLMRMTESFFRKQKQLEPFPRTLKVTVYKGSDILASAKAMKAEAEEKDRLVLARAEFRQRVKEDIAARHDVKIEDIRF